jgi:hypothetical protein
MSYFHFSSSLGDVKKESMPRVSLKRDSKQQNHSPEFPAKAKDWPEFCKQYKAKTERRPCEPQCSSRLEREIEENQPSSNLATTADDSDELAKKRGAKDESQREDKKASSEIPYDRNHAISAKNLDRDSTSGDKVNIKRDSKQRKPCLNLASKTKNAELSRKHKAKKERRRVDDDDLSSSSNGQSSGIPHDHTHPCRVKNPCQDYVSEDRVLCDNERPVPKEPLPPPVAFFVPFVDAESADETNPQPVPVTVNFEWFRSAEPVENEESEEEIENDIKNQREDEVVGERRNIEDLKKYNLQVGTNQLRIRILTMIKSQIQY